MQYLFILITLFFIISHTNKPEFIPAVTYEREATPLPIPSLSPSPRPRPEVKILTNGTQVFQTFNNCGPASLSMALSYYGITVSQQTLGRELRPYQHPQGDNDDKSVTLSELSKRAEAFGLVAYQRPAGDIEMLEKFIAEEIPVVTRTWLKPNEDIGHYRVVKGYDQTTQELIQDDSLQGKNLRYSYQEFLRMWEAFNYEFVVLVPSHKQEIVEQILGERLDEISAWELALKLADNQIKTDPGNMYAHFNRSVALFHLGKYQESVEAYEPVSAKLPSRMLWYQIEPLLAYYQLGDYEKVLAESTEILANHNRAYSELYYLQGLIYQQQGQPDLVETAFARAEMYNSTQYWKNNLYVSQPGH